MVMEIKPHLKDIINDLQKYNALKIQLTIKINFISSRDTDKEQAMHSKSVHIEVMTYDNLEEIIRKLFDSLLSRYQ